MVWAWNLGNGSHFVGETGSQTALVAPARAQLSRDVMLERSSAFVNDTMDFLQFPARCVPSHDLVYMEALPLHVHAAFTHVETLLALKSLGGERMRAAVAQGVLKSWWWAAAAVPLPPGWRWQRSGRRPSQVRRPEDQGQPGGPRES